MSDYPRRVFLDKPGAWNNKFYGSSCVYCGLPIFERSAIAKKRAHGIIVHYHESCAKRAGVEEKHKSSPPPRPDPLMDLANQIL